MLQDASRLEAQKPFLYLCRMCCQVRTFTVSSLWPLLDGLTKTVGSTGFDYCSGIAVPDYGLL